MHIDLSSYNSQRDVLRRICRAAYEPVEALDFSVIVEQLTLSGHALLDDVRTKLDGRVFRVLVAGEFNAGKSFFINTMLDGWTQRTDPETGKLKWNGILGVASVPATTLLTELRFGLANSAEIFLRDGTSVPLSISDVAAFTDLAGFARGSTAHVANAQIFTPLASRLGIQLSDLADVGPGASSTISEWLFQTFDRAIVSIHAPMLTDKVVIVDSPGLGAVFHEHETITEGEMRRADAIIFLIASTSPLGEHAIKFLQTSHAFVDNFFFVQTKTDQLSAEDVLRAKDRNSAIIAEVLAKDRPALRYALVSARNYRAARHGGSADAMIDSGFPALLHDLSAFLVAERGAPTLRLETDLVARVLSQAQRQCEHAERLARATMSELDAEAALVQDERMQFSIVARRATVTIASGCDEALQALDKRTSALHDQLAERVQSMNGTGGLGYSVGRVFRASNLDDDLAISLRSVAYEFADNLTRKDVAAIAKRTLDAVSSLSDVEMPARLAPLRVTLPQATVRTDFFDKLLKQHVPQYSSAAESYERQIVEAIETQIRQYFGTFEQIIGDRFLTQEAELAHKEAQILRSRLINQGSIMEEQAQLAERGKQIASLRAEVEGLLGSITGAFR